ncbi:MAG: FecR domain-containing protein [Tannerella sp.]|jgi:ferric-dicitrate binding protein FerR (iron transport regulator)|nr:FecR domain-containing protein [Tannerella sp.]
MNKEKTEQKDRYDFLSDDSFILWRLFQTSELNALWQNYITEHPSEETEIRHAIKEFGTIRLNDYSVDKARKSFIYEQIIGSSEAKVISIRRVKVIRWICAAAASVALLVGLTVYMTKDELRQPVQTATVESENAGKVTGKTLESKELQLITGDVVKEFERNTEIELMGDGKAVVNMQGSEKETVALSKTDMNTLIAPFGRRAAITLSDGTKIRLNSGSRLTFPSEFVGNTREITVEGEAFLEVAKDAECQFIVHTGKIDVMVYGTSFNISAYGDIANQSVVLCSGKVEVVKTSSSLTDRIKMQPGEMLTLDNDKLEKQNVDVSTYISWLDGVLILKKTPLSEALKMLERYYNVEFEGGDDKRLSMRTVSGKLVLEDSIDDVLLSLSVLTNSKIEVVRD